MIRLALPSVVVAVLAGAGVYGMLARRNLVMVLVGAELLLAAAGLLFVMAAAYPVPPAAAGQPSAPDPLVSGHVATIMTITIAAAEIGLALAVILLLYRVRSTSDVTEIRELGEASPTYPGPGDTLRETV